MSSPIQPPRRHAAAATTVGGATGGSSRRGPREPECQWQQGRATKGCEGAVPIGVVPGVVTARQHVRPEAGGRTAASVAPSRRGRADTACQPGGRQRPRRYRAPHWRCWRPLSARCLTREARVPARRGAAGSP